MTMARMVAVLELNVLSIAASIAVGALDWKIIQNVDAVPGVSAHSVNLGEIMNTGTAGLSECQGRCVNRSGCNIFTFNHHTTDRKTSCFGGVNADAHWVDTYNSHCTSGCRGDACNPAPVAPTPTPDPSLHMPTWEGPLPSVATNKSAGLRVVPDSEHICVYNATLSNGSRNPNGVYNHGIACIQGGQVVPGDPHVK